jgi:hypothetical protein
MFLLFFLSIVSGGSGDRATFYIGVEGTDSSNCDGGSRENPWRTWRVPVESGCIQPGSRVYFLAGRYKAGTGVFEQVETPRIPVEEIYVPGKPGKPVLIAVDSEATGEWPVQFEGGFLVTGSHGIIKGIEFDSGPDPIGLIVGVNGSHFELRDNYVHGPPIISDSNQFDCIKFLEKKYVLLSDDSRDISNERTGGFRILYNRVSNCSGDGIDSTGSRNLLYKGNTFHRAGLGIKGGTEDIVVEQNTFTDSSIGTWDMRGNSGFTTGNSQDTRPIAQRFAARNIIIRNNIIIISDNNEYAIRSAGWLDGQISHNTILTAGAGLVLGKAGFDFRDDTAKSYCRETGAECRPCKNADRDCWYVGFPSRNVLFRNNIVSVSGVHGFGEAVRVEFADSLQSFEAGSNIYFDSTGPVLFHVSDPGHEATYLGVKNFPYEAQSYETDPGLISPTFDKAPLDPADFALVSGSFAIDRGVDLGIHVDYWGRPRDESPDIGALENGTAARSFRGSR